MQDPNEDTQWNDILRSKGILPPKEKEISEDEIVNMVEATIQDKSTGKSLEECDLDELDLLEDEEDERVIAEYRRKRIEEMKAFAARCKFGCVEEITAHEYVDQVNNAGEGIWVVVHLYKQGIPLCAIINEHMKNLAMRFRSTKFIKSISTTCIPNYPDKNLPALFVYLNGEMKHQLVGPAAFRHNDITVEELEWMLGEIGAIETDIKEDPRPKPKDVLFSSLRAYNDED